MWNFISALSEWGFLTSVSLILAHLPLALLLFSIKTEVSPTSFLLALFSTQRDAKLFFAFQPDVHFTVRHFTKWISALDFSFNRNRDESSLKQRLLSYSKLSSVWNSQRPAHPSWQYKIPQVSFSFPLMGRACCTSLPQQHYSLFCPSTHLQTCKIPSFRPVSLSFSWIFSQAPLYLKTAHLTNLIYPASKSIGSLF